MKTQKSTTECSFVQIFVLRLTTDDIGSKRTNRIFGCFGNVRQTNIPIPTKIPFIWNCVFLNFFFKKWGGGGGRPPPPPVPCKIGLMFDKVFRCCDIWRTSWEARKHEGDCWERERAFPNLPNLSVQRSRSQILCPTNFLFHTDSQPHSRLSLEKREVCIETESQMRTEHCQEEKGKLGHKNTS